IQLWLCTIPALMVLDVIWLGLVAKNYYKTQLGDLLAPTVTWWAAGLLYVLYAAGMVFFVIQPALAAQSFTRALVTGFFFGLVAFCIYDLTNLATTAHWPLAMSFVDMAYGAVVGALASGAVYLVAIKWL
ncbi:MAG TPA: DUF2177 family protein, partial [Candidatus Paceibacterota bacterium]|nr:DUF2177 family protein [Candidatus Paceibacterota bacterium]